MQDNSKSDLAAKFEQFHRHIEMTIKRRNQIAAAHKQLAQTVLLGFGYVDKTRLAGAFARKTLLQQSKTVDVFVFVDQQFVDLSPSSVLNKLHKDLTFSHPNSVLNPDKSCIWVNINHCTFELIPVVCAREKFNIPANSSDNWLVVEPEAVLQQKLVEANRQSAGKIIPLIQMIKVWQQKHRISPASSFEIEQQIINHLNTFDSYREGVEKLLGHFGWCDRIYSSYQIQRMDNYQFGHYCRDTLFGDLFPE